MVDVAICVGHSRIGDKTGAISVSGEDEYNYNRKVAAKLHVLLSDAGISSEIISHYPHRGYTSAMQWVGRKVKQLGARCAVELHFNAAERASASGHEWLVYEGSASGYVLGKCFEVAMKEARPDAPVRGVKPRRKNERGWAFLYYTPCPASVLEPFFGSNAPESNEMIPKPEYLAEIYAAALKTYMQK